MGARKRQIGFVGVDDARFAVGDDETVGIAVGDRFGGVVAARLAGKLQHAERVEQEPKAPKIASSAIVSEIA